MGSNLKVEILASVISLLVKIILHKNAKKKVVNRYLRLEINKKYILKMLQSFLDQKLTNKKHNNYNNL